MGTINIVGTGGIIEGNLGSANVNVNLDAVHTFDGTDDFLLATSSKGDIEWSGTAFSITAWIYMTDSSRNVIMSLVPSTSSNDGAVLILDEDDSNHYYSLALCFKEYGTSSNDNTVGVTAAAKLHTNVWHHIAVTYNGSGSGTLGNYNFYIDGQLFDTGKTLLANDFSARTDTLTANKVYIGRDKENFTTGNLADVRLYDDVLTATEVGEIASKINYESSGADNLIGRWKIAGSSIDLTDSSSNSNNATASGSPATVYDKFSVDVYDNSTTTDGTFTVTQGKVEGLALTSVDFDGSDDYINIGDANSFSFGDGSNDEAFSISAWINMDDATSFPIISKGVYNTNAEWNFKTESDDKLYLILYDESVSSTQEYACTTATLTAHQDKWIHVTATYNGVGGTSANAGIKLYVNGVAEAMTLGDAGTYVAMENLAASIHIGRYDSQYANGSIRDVRIYGQELSADQVASLYSNTLLQTPQQHFELNQAASPFADTGTSSAGQGYQNGGATVVNGTLDLDGTLTIAANGTMSCPRGNLDLAVNLEINCTTVADQWIHNSGKVRWVSSGTHIQLDTGGATFNNVDLVKSSGHDVKLREDITILGTLDLTNANGYWIVDAAGAAADVTMTMGSSTASGTIESSDANRFRLNTHSSGKCIIQGASSLFPCNVTSNDWKWDYAAGAAGTELANIDFQTALDTHSEGSNAAKITLTGDCEFDAVTVSSGDTLDLNGQRAYFSGDLKNGGTMDIDGMIVCGRNLDLDVSATANDNKDKALIFMRDNANTRYLDIPDGTYKGLHLLGDGGVFLRDHNLGTTPVTIGATASTDLAYDLTCGNLTIPTGGALNADQETYTVAGDFTTSGGLLGASCLTLNGSDENVNVPDAAALDEPNTADLLTVECWMNADDLGSGIGEKAMIGRDSVFRLYLENSPDVIRLQVYTDAGDWQTVDSNTLYTSLTAGKWYHIAGTWDGSTVKLYIDGKLDAEASGSGSMQASSSALKLGSYRTGSEMWWDGSLDELRLWKVARTPAQIRADMFQGGTLANSTGLVGRWNVDEGTGTSVASTVNSLTGTATGTGVWAGAGTFTYGTSTLTMTGTSKNMNLPNAFDVYNLIINGTITANWVNADDSYLKIRGTVFTVGSSKTLSTNGYIRLYDEDLTLTFNTPATNISGVTTGLQTRHSSGTLSVPEVTTTYLLCETSGGTTQATGDLTITTELQVASGTTFNANGNTIEVDILDVNGGTLDMRNSDFIMQSGGAVAWHDTSSTILSGNTTLTGHSSANKTDTYVPAAGNYEIVGDVKFLKLDAGASDNFDLTVVGAVIDCDVSAAGANIRQWHHTLDTQQLLDADEAGDDDLRLEKPALDNAVELQTG